VNGQARELRPSAQGVLTVDLAKLPASELRKTPALCGPIKDVFNRRFLFVYGTAGGKDATAANRALAEAMARDWREFAKGDREPIPETDLTDAEIARSHLILLGTPNTHALLARIAPRLPIRFTDTGYQILDHTYKASETTGLMCLYPNPLAPERYVLVCSGYRYGEHLPPNHKYDLLPDFIVYSDVQDYDDTNGTYCAGFFDTTWQLDPKLVWTSDGRARPKPAAVPPEPAPAAP
jgi:hypothetical protein